MRLDSSADCNLTALRSVGVGKPKVENLIKEELDYLCDQVSKHESKPVKIRHYLSSSASNIVFAVTLGQRWNYDHPTRLER